MKNQNVADHSLIDVHISIILYEETRVISFNLFRMKKKMGRFGVFCLLLFHCLKNDLSAKLD